MTKNIIIPSLFILLVIFTFFYYLSDLTDYGVTWDEFFHRGTGRLYFEFLQNKDLTPIIANDQNSWFPPIASTIGYVFLESGFLKEIYPQAMDRFHLAAVLFGSITVGTVFLIAFVLFKNTFLALFSAILLMQYPQFVVQAHNNVRDIGLTMFYTISILVLLVSVERKRTLLWVALSGILAGITTDTKQNGAFLVFIGLAFFWLHIKKLGARKVIAGSFLFLILFMTTFFALWPYLWLDTSKRLALVWNFLTNPNIIAGWTVFYDKVYYSMKNIPIYYPWAMLFLLTPPIVGFLSLVGLAGSFLSLFSSNKKLSIIFLWIFIILARFFFPLSSITYDQIRHFFEIVPTLPLLSALAVYLLYQQFGKSAVLKYLIFVLSLIAIVHTVYINYQYKPYGTAYFNFFAGPSIYVNHAFDIEYWGSVYRKAVPELLNRHGKSTVYYISGLGAHLLMENGFASNQITDDLNQDFQYVIFMNKQSILRLNPYAMWLVKNKKPIYTIERGGKIVFYQFEPYKEEYMNE